MSARSPPDGSAWPSLRRLKPFDVELHYTDRHRLPEAVEKELGPDVPPERRLAGQVCDVVTINCPLHPETEGLFDDELLSTDEAGRYIVNTARGKICDRDAVVRALESAGSWRATRVTSGSPARPGRPPVADDAPPRDDTAHLGSSLSAQARYAAGTREILECFFDSRPIREEYLIVDAGNLAGAGAHSYGGRHHRAMPEKAAR